MCIPVDNYTVLQISRFKVKNTLHTRDGILVHAHCNIILTNLHVHGLQQTMTRMMGHDTGTQPFEILIKLFS